jgi:hypothetical protein
MRSILHLVVLFASVLQTATGAIFDNGKAILTPERSNLFGIARGGGLFGGKSKEAG